MKSDHNILYAKFSIQYNDIAWKRPRKEFFNLKNPECQAKFKEVTSNSNKLKNCFTDSASFPDQCNKFEKSFDDILHQCFKKVKVGNRNKKSEISELLKRKAELTVYLNKNEKKHEVIEVRNEIKKIEEQISNLISLRNVSLVQDHVQNLENLEGNYHQLGMWRLKNKLISKELDPPMGKLDTSGNLITAPSALKQREKLA